MKVLITGGTGFIGSHLSRMLLKDGHDVVIAADPAQKKKPWPWSDAQQKALVPLDIKDKQAVTALVARERPDEVYHLAAQSLPAISWRQPEETMTTNALGTIHIFEAMKAAGIRPRTFVACSSAEYGIVPPEETPVSEERILRPVHPYGVSKVAQDLLSYQYWKNDGIPAIRGRIFNTTGPGKSADAPGDFAERIVALEKAAGGGREAKGVLRVGNLTPKRDLSDVRDQARAIVMITRKGAPGDVYNLCTGRTITIQHLVDKFVEHAKVPLKVEVDPALLRPTDEPVIWGDNAKLVAATGYEATVPIERTVRDMLAQLRGEHVEL